jgi:hypothetical protein
VPWRSHPAREVWLKVQRGKLNGTSRSFPPLFSIYRGVEWSTGFRTCLIIPPCQPLDAGCPTTDARIQNLKTLISMLFVQSALPDYSLNEGPDYLLKYPSKEIPQ